MATPWPRETFVIPGDAGQVARTINMIKVDDAFRTQLLTIFNGATSDLLALYCLSAPVPPRYRSFRVLYRYL